MPANGKELMNRYNKLDSDSGNHKNRWERMAPYVAPSRCGIVGGYSDGERQQRNVYDSTTLLGAELLAQFMAGHIINPAQRWIGWRIRDRRFKRNDEIKEYLDECRDITLKNAASSAFYAEGPEAIVDTVGFGTGFEIIEEAPQPVNRTISGFRGFMVSATKTGRFLIQDGADGRVDTAFRKFPLSARVIKERWPAAQLPLNIQAAISKGEQDRPFDIIHAIYPRPKIDRGYGAKGMAWASCWVEKDSTEVIHESGYPVFPVAVPRYSKTPGEVFGRGRADIAWGDTFTLNSAKKMSFEDWALKLRPPILHGSDSVIGVFKLIPGAPISVNLNGRPIGDSVAPFQTGSHPEVSQINEENLRKSIREIFFVEYILALLEIHKSEMTLFEYSKKLELIFRLLGPVYGRLEYDWLYPTADIMWDLQFRGGAFPPPPPVVEQTDGQIDVEFDNPISRAQKSTDGDALAMTLSDLAPFAQNDPSVLDWYDTDNIPPEVMDMRGLPARWQRSPEQVQKIREARSKQNQVDLELDRATQIAEAAGKAAPALVALKGGKAA